jgi:hypothetical protein
VYPLNPEILYVFKNDFNKFLTEMILSKMFEKKCSFQQFFEMFSTKKFSNVFDKNVFHKNCYDKLKLNLSFVK